MSIHSSEIYDNRYYEGEHVFSCQCGTQTVIYAFQGEDLSWLNAGTIPCEKCNRNMYYEGYASGPDSITRGIISLLESRHYMAAIVVIAAFVEYQIDNLLWALLIDAGLPHDKATAVANGTLPRGDAIRMIRNLLGRKIGNIVFPMRNEVAHGRAFGKNQNEYSEAVSKQIEAIKKWVLGIKSDYVPPSTNYSEIDRWLLSMEHWVDYMQIHWKSQSGA